MFFPGSMTLSLLTEDKTSLTRALSSVRKSSSSGLDQIDYSIILNLPPEYLDSLLGIFISSLSMSFRTHGLTPLSSSFLNQVSHQLDLSHDLLFPNLWNV